MNFNFINNISAMYFYLISIICFVISNIIREKSLPVYYTLLVLGLVLFVLGFMKRMKTK